jgi:hypothetical protein
LEDFAGSDADWLDEYKGYIEDGETVIVSPHKPGFPRWLRRYGTLPSVRSLVRLVLHDFHVTTSGIPYG